MEKVYLVTRQHKLVGLTFVKLHGSAAFIIQQMQLLHMVMLWTRLCLLYSEIIPELAEELSC